MMTEMALREDAHDEVSPEIREANAAAARRMETLPDPAARTRQRAALLFANSLDEQTVAKLLNESLFSTRERIGNRQLYAFTSTKGWRVPAFQFVDGRLIRNIDRVTPRLPHDLHPLEVMHWFFEENPDLRLDHEPISPIAWLEAGGDPSRVEKFAEVLGRPV